MSEIQYDPQLAWDIQEWSDLGDDGQPILNRGQIKNLANYLGTQGYSKGKGGLSSLLSTLEETGAKLVDEFGPLIDGLRKPK